MGKKYTIKKKTTNWTFKLLYYVPNTNPYRSSRYYLLTDWLAERCTATASFVSLMTNQSSSIMTNQNMWFWPIRRVLFGPIRLWNFTSLFVWNGPTRELGRDFIRCSLALTRFSVCYTISQCVEVAGLLLGQGIYKNQLMNSKISGTTNWYLSPLPPL